MRVWIRSFNIPHLPPPPTPYGNHLGIWTFEDWFVQTPVAFPRGGGGGETKTILKFPTQVPDSIVIFFVRGNIIARDFLLINKDLKSRL